MRRFFVAQTRRVMPLGGFLLAAIFVCRGAETAPTEQDQIVHVLNRITFGPRPGDVAAVEKMGLDNYIQQQLHPDIIDDSQTDAALASFTILNMTSEDLSQMYLSAEEQKKELKKEANAKNNAAASTTGHSEAKPVPALKPLPEPVKALFTEADVPSGAEGDLYREIAGEMIDAKLVRAIDSRRQLQEVLVDFWNNHFNIDLEKKACRVYGILADRDAIRPNIWGHFRDLVEASAKSPAMLTYLDNVSNSAGPSATSGNTFAAPAPPRMTENGKVKAEKPHGINENYARELMELHTIGVNGGYTQKDVQEVARCFTGWTFSKYTGAFEFKNNRHDNGQKIVLGHVIPANGGMRDGEMVLDILCSSPACAHFISRELCQRFVSDNPPESLVDRIAQVFTETQGNLRQVTQAILTSPEFLSPSDYRTKIKSPFEFAVSAVRASGSVMVMIPPDKKGRDMFARDGGSLKIKNDGHPGHDPSLTLNWQIYNLGEPLFGCVPPTGYPEDSERWVNAGALIGRLNFAMALTEQKVSNIRFDPSKIIPGADAGQPQAVLDQCLHTLLHNEVSDTTRQVLERNAMPATGDAQAADPGKLIALIIGSPEFQRK